MALSLSGRFSVSCVISGVSLSSSTTSAFSAMANVAIAVQCLRDRLLAHPPQQFEAAYRGHRCVVEGNAVLVARRVDGVGDATERPHFGGAQVANARDELLVAVAGNHERGARDFGRELATLNVALRRALS